MDEFSLIRQLVGGIPTQGEGLLCGVGDDCAVLTGSGTRDWLMTVDAFIEGVHFRREWGPWAAIGRKAALVNISDIAAMGGRPRFFLVTLAIPSDLPAMMVAEVYSGLREAAECFQMVVIGGDTVGNKRGLTIAITAVGEVPHGRAVYRRGAKPGDGVYVTGSLGGAAVGLAILQKKSGWAKYAPFIERHSAPAPRVAAGQWLAATGCLTAMIDLSDGLIGDLEQIGAASGVGMRLEGIRLPLFPDLGAVVSAWGEDPVAYACASGEEYELAFTVAGAREEAFQRFLPAAEKTFGHPVTRVGVVTTGAAVVVTDPAGHPMALPRRGYRHQFSDGGA